MSATAKGIVLDTWAGRRYYAVELVGETPKKARAHLRTFLIAALIPFQPTFTNSQENPASPGFLCPILGGLTS